MSLPDRSVVDSSGKVSMPGHGPSDGNKVSTEEDKDMGSSSPRRRRHWYSLETKKDNGMYSRKWHGPE